MKKSEKPDWVLEADQLIRQGQGQKVRDLLTKIQRRGVPRDQLVECAHLARRVGMFSFAINILFRSVYQEVGKPDPDHVAEYAANSSAAGNYVEAARLFESLPEEILGSYAIEYADSLFKMWDYQKACAHLENHAPENYQSYREMVYGLNLASALIETGQINKAKPLLLKLSKVSEDNSWDIIWANAKELYGQVQFYEKDYSRAEELFSSSEDLLRSSGNVSWLYSRKWRVVIELAQNGWSAPMALKLNEVKKLAREFMHWETLRECDFYEALFSENEVLFQRVYFGTPHETYRERILKRTGERFSLNPKVPLGRLRPEFQHNLDVAWGDFAEDSEPLKLTTQSRKLLQVLVSDLYRPVSIYEIFQVVFDEPYFNPFSSKDRTYKAIAALKKSLEGHPSKASVTARKGYGYRFRAESQINLIYPHGQAENEGHPLLKKISAESFSRKEFCEALGLKDRSGSRQLKALVEEGALQKVGSGAATRYKKTG